VVIAGLELANSSCAFDNLDFAPSSPETRHHDRKKLHSALHRAAMAIIGPSLATTH
jgi:hypothetical protein